MKALLAVVLVTWTAGHATPAEAARTVKVKKEGERRTSPRRTPTAGRRAPKALRLGRGARLAKSPPAEILGLQINLEEAGYDEVTVEGEGKDAIVRGVMRLPGKATLRAELSVRGEDVRPRWTREQVEGLVNAYLFDREVLRGAIARQAYLSRELYPPHRLRAQREAWGNRPREQRRRLEEIGVTFE